MYLSGSTAEGGGGIVQHIQHGSACSRGRTPSSSTTPSRLAGHMRDLVVRPHGIVEHLEGVLELRRDRDVEFFTGRQARDKPLVVERNQIAVRAELAERAFHHRRKL